MKVSLPLLVACIALAGTAGVTAQSSDALLNKLVDKGILTVEEARELKAESDKNFTTAYAAKSGMPEWVTGFKFSGDFRGRYDSIWSENDAYTQRNRWRYRLRAGVTLSLKEDFELGVGLISSDVDGGTTTGNSGLASNQSFQNNASKKGVLLDKAYAKWSPLHTDDWEGSVTFGKMEDPYVFSPLGAGLGLGIDPDYTPEGAALPLSYSLSDSQKLSWINGAFVLDEIGASGSDPYLVGSQLRLDSKWSKRISTSFGAMVMVFANVDQLPNAGVPNANVGNWRNAATVPEYNFNPILGDASVTYLFDSAPLYPGAFPVRVAGAYMVNPAAPSYADPEGWTLGAALGKAGKKGTWEISYSYKWLGANSIWEEVVDDDFGAYWASTDNLNFGKSPDYLTGTNVRGHIVKVSYAPYNFLILSVKWYITELINEPAVPPGADAASGTQRVQVDALFKF